MDPNKPLDEIIETMWADYKNSQLNADSMAADPSHIIFTKGFFYAYNYLNAGKKEKPQEKTGSDERENQQWPQQYY